VSEISDQSFQQLLRGHLKYLKPGDELDLDAELKPLGLDSMASLDLLFDIEDRFGVVMPDEYLNEHTFATGSALRAAVEKIAAQDPAR
jgi:acyl carrier protein